MALHTEQGFEYEGNDYWRWWVWLDGPEPELDAVDHVVYTLHSSFPNPVRKAKDHSTNFRLEAAGWGTFTIFAKVVGLNGEEEHIEHELELLYPDDAPAPRLKTALCIASPMHDNLSESRDGRSRPRRSRGGDVAPAF